LVKDRWLLRNQGTATLPRRSKFSWNCIIGVTCNSKQLGKSFNIKPSHSNYHPTYKILSHLELIEYLKNKNTLSGAGMIITELGDKFMLIKWERFKD
jgi:hypothetical protein